LSFSYQILESWNPQVLIKFHFKLSLDIHDQLIGYFSRLAKAGISLKFAAKFLAKAGTSKFPLNSISSFPRT